MQPSAPISSQRDAAAKSFGKKILSPSSTIAWNASKALISIGLTLAAIYLVFSRGDAPSFEVLSTRFSANLLFVVIALAVGATVLSVWRLKLIAQDLGYRISIRDAIATLSFGHLFGATFLQLVGQSKARGALLSRSGTPIVASQPPTAYEDAAAACIPVLTALGGGGYLLNGIIALDIEHGGLVFLKIVAGLTLALTAGAWLAWGSKAAQVLPQQSDRAYCWSIARNLLLGLAIQTAIMGTYVAAAHDVAPAVPLLDLAAASAIIVLAASFPISFAGWGMRELAAIAALGIVGVPWDAALVVAILIGTVSLVVTGVFAVSSFWGGADRIRMTFDRDSATDYVTMLAWALPIATATMVFFQLYVPVGRGVLNVNLADPLAIVGGVLFLITLLSARRWPVWRLSYFNVHLVGITAVLTLSLLHGAAVFGWTSWALTNRFVGWFFLLGYGATGALLALRAPEGFSVALKTFVVAACAIVILDLGLVVAVNFGLELPNEMLFLRIGGFAQNPNAFAFQVLLALCASFVANFRPKIAIAVTTICFVGIWFAVSRAVFIALPFVIAFALYARVLTPRHLVVSVVLAAIIIAALFAMPTIASVILIGLQEVRGTMIRLIYGPAGPFSPGHIRMPAPRFDLSTETGESNAERITSLKGALDIFLAHPIFGGGLGLFVTTHLRDTGKLLVIHSTPAWLLAETGIAGFAVIASLFGRVFYAEFGPARRGDPIATLLVLMLLSMVIVSSVHELFYQRGFWFLFGAALAMAQIARQHNAPLHHA
jgi:hypothetical protein